jgi:hypothetical protein
MKSYQFYLRQSRAIFLRNYFKHSWSFKPFFTLKSINPWLRIIQRKVNLAPYEFLLLLHVSPNILPKNSVQTKSNCSFSSLACNIPIILLRVQSVERFTIALVLWSYNFPSRHFNLEFIFVRRLNFQSRKFRLLFTFMSHSSHHCCHRKSL